MKKSGFTLTLQSGGRSLGSLQMTPGCAAAQIGRASSCALRAARDDLSVSGRHANVYWKGSSLLIEDADSRNGIFRRGVRLKKPHKISDGDVYALGNCSLKCEKGEGAKERRGEQFHRLEYLNGVNAGKAVDIRPDNSGRPFSIGLDPGNTICLADMLVSRHHATLTVKEDGECWLKDNDSRNGTYVNGEPLRGKERLLKDNDKITIAYFDFRFLDRAVSHTRFFLWVKVFAIAATLSIVAGVYVTWVMTSASVDDSLGLTRRQAAERDFAAARQTLDSTRLLRDADKYRAQIDALDAQLERWERTSAEWDKAQELLQAGALASARQVLDPLTGATLDAWVWNGTTAVEEKRRAEWCAQALRRYYDAEDALSEADVGQPEHQADNVGVRVAELRAFMRDSEGMSAGLPCVAELTNRLHRALGRMETIRAGFMEVDGCIGKLDAFNPDFDALAKQLDAIVQDKSRHGAVRSYADKYKIPCAELAAAKRFIGDEFTDVCAMRFASVREKSALLRLPKKELCSRHPRLSEHRAKLDGHHADAQSLASGLASMVGALANVGVAGDACGLPLEHVLDTGLWKKALSFDCLDGKPPTSRRKVPAGAYDELIGVDYTFKSLRALPEEYNGWCLKMIGFTPDAVEARKAMEYVDVFVKYVSERPVWLRKGKLGAFHAFCQDLQRRRANVVEFLSSYKGESDTERGRVRTQVVAQFYAIYLSGDADIVKRKALSDRFREIRREVSELCDRYSNLSDPEEQISVRAQILATGIPGDELLHAKWVQKYEGAER